MTSPSGSSSYTPVGVETFNAAVKGVEELIEKIKTELTNLINGVNSFLKKVQKELDDSFWGSVVEFFTGDIEEAIEKIVKLTEQARDKINEILGKAEKSVSGSVPVASLFSRAFDLGDKVNRPLTGMPGDMTGSGEVDFWRGPTKDTYEKRVGDQQDAVANASSKVTSLASFLGDAATGNMTYMSSLAERMGELYGALTVVIIDIAETAAGAVTQVVVTLQDFSEVIGTAVTQIIGYIANLGTRISEVMNQILALQNSNSDLTGLTADGGWPSPVAE